MKPIKKNALEWTVFTAGLLVMIALFSYLIYLMVTERNSPPLIQVSLETEPKLPAYTFRVTIRNTGDETAMNVTTEFSLENKGQVIEKTELQIDHLPKGSTREGWIVFVNNPQQADTMIAKVVSFLKP